MDVKEPLRVEPPFFIFVNGHSGSGKTTYALDLIERDYAGYFKRMFVICPTFEYNDTYQAREWIHNYPAVLPVRCTIGTFYKAVSVVVQKIRCSKDKVNTLLLLDDCSASSDTKKLSGIMVELAQYLRHLKISVILMSQHLRGIALPIRTNLSKLVTFAPANTTESEAIRKEFLGPKYNSRRMTEIVDAMRANSYARLEVTCKSPYDARLVIPKTSQPTGYDPLAD